MTGKARLNRSGVVNVPINRDFVDITVPGGTTAASLGFAVLQRKVTGVWILAIRPAYPTAATMRVSLDKIVSTTSVTPLAWFVLS